MTEQCKPDRTLSNQVASNIHIDDFNKAMIVVGIRRKEETIAHLESRLNEYPTLKAATETLSANDERAIISVDLCDYMSLLILEYEIEATYERTRPLMAYADIL